MKKSTDKIQSHLWLEQTSANRKGREILQSDRGHLKQTLADIVVNGEPLPTTNENKGRMSVFPSSRQHCMGKS